MARAVWSGVISFGLVSIPVGLYTATEEHEPSFHQFAEGTTDRIRYKRVNERTGDEVDYSDIVKGVDVGGGHYVMVTDDELDQVAPGRSRALEISDFVALGAIDPLYFNKSYYLSPATEENKRTYALLREAMARTDRAGIARLVMHGKEHLAAIRADGPTLVLTTLLFADEVRDPKQMLDILPGRTSFRGGELKMAEQLVESMSDEWDPGRYRDTYTDRVNDLIEAKRKGNEIETTEPAPEATNVVDLMDALRASVGSSGSSGRGRRSQKKTGSREKAATPKKAARNKSATPNKSSTPKKSATAKKADRRRGARRAPAKKAASRTTGRSARKATRKAS